MLDLMVGGSILLQVWLRQLCSYVSGTVTLFEWIAPGCFSVKCQTWKTKTKQLTDNQWKPQGAAAATWEAVAVVARSPNQKVLMTWEQTNWKEMKKSIKLRFFWWHMWHQFMMCSGLWKKNTLPIMLDRHATLLQSTAWLSSSPPSIWTITSLDISFCLHLSGTLLLAAGTFTKLDH